MNLIYRPLLVINNSLKKLILFQIKRYNILFKSVKVKILLDITITLIDIVTILINIIITLINIIAILILIALILIELQY